MATSVDPRYLSAEAAARYEAELFIAQHPEYFPCQANKNAINELFLRHKLKPTVGNFEKVYKILCDEGRILPRETAMATMTAEELTTLARQRGTPVYDDYGRLQGYDWPEDWQNAPPSPSTIKRQSGQWNSVQCSLAPPEGAEKMGHGFRPSKAQFHAMTAAQLRYWMSENGFTEIPAYLR